MAELAEGIRGVARVALALVVCAALGLGAGVASAAEGQGETELEVEALAPADEGEVPEIEVEVVGKREGLLSISPAPGEQVVEVTAADIADLGAQTVLEAIELTPSVFVRHQGARYENRISIRGMTPRLVLLDGLPVAREGTSGPGGGAGGAEAAFAGRILYTMPAEVIERIDVIRTGNTIVYGPTAAAGSVINIVTREPAPGARVSAALHKGSFSQQRALVDAGVNDPPLSFLVLAGSDYAGSHLPLGEKRFKDIFGKLVYDYPDGSRLLVDVYTLEGRRRLDLSQDFSIVPARYWEIAPWKERFANLVWSQALSEEETLDVVFYLRNRDFSTNQYTDATFGVVSQDWREAEDDHGVDLRWSARRQDGTLTRTGLQWSQLDSYTLQRWLRGARAGERTEVSEKLTTWSLFANHVVPVRADLRASVGARYDKLRGHSPDLSLQAGAEVTVSPQSTWYANLGTGVERPRPTARDLEEGEIPVEAPSLSAETGWTVRPDELSRINAALFWVRTRDARVLYNDPPGSIGPTAWRSKAEDLTTAGLELVYDRRLSDQVTAFANYTHLVERVSNKNSPQIPGPLYPYLPKPPRHIVGAGLRAAVGQARVALNAKYASSYFAQSRLMSTAAPVDAYLVFDLRVTHPVGPGELAVSVDNLLDADYETMPAFPRPGRNYLASYRWSF